mmetsp:Transcript_3253/g.11822  ORF Transcript_3253/g.11822 Transcript_3253/m.11822 type:complete len:225 (-) Transcript_3253:353-1027(-)
MQVQVFPPEVTFRAVTPGVVHSTVIAIKNVDTRARIIKVSHPTTSVFKLNGYQPSLKLAPGLETALEVAFQADASGRDYEDELHVVTETETLAVPLRAYRPMLSSWSGAAHGSTSAPSSGMPPSPGRLSSTTTARLPCVSRSRISRTSSTSSRRKASSRLAGAPSSGSGTPRSPSESSPLRWRWSTPGGRKRTRRAVRPRSRARRRTGKKSPRSGRSSRSRRAW